MTRSQFFINALALQIKSYLRKDPDLSNNPNGLLLKVWQENGLRLKRRQHIPTFLLPDISEVFQIVQEIELQKQAELPMMESQGQELRMDYEKLPTEPKTRKKIQVNVRKKKK